MTIDVWSVHHGYEDALGRWHDTAAGTVRAIRAAMALPEDDLATPPPVLVARAGRTTRLPAPGELTLENGTTVPVDGRLPADLPIGYHSLSTSAHPGPVSIILAPPSCHLPRGLRAWGWAVQLYASRSRGSWGIGDLSDLHVLAHWAAGDGAGVILVNPLGATTPLRPQEPSPYYPGSRRFRNLLYLRIDAVPGAGSGGLDLNRLDVLGRALNDDPLIDRDRVFDLKLTALELLWRRFPGDARFDEYCREQGLPLRQFATFAALAESYGTGWHRWRDEHRTPRASGVRRFAEDCRDRIRFHEWVQWLLDEQLREASTPLAVVHDLPIGFDPDGVDAWVWQDVLARRVTVGAPPDEFNTRGQDWKLPPFVPAKLRAARYEPFIQTIRAALRHAGGLRIDHVMGLFRLYWIPEGEPASRGAFVSNPGADLLAILAIESHRAKAVIVGEDLGTVDPVALRQLRRHRVLSYRLVWFERTPPAKYPRLALSAVTTHDLPTVAGLWTGSDLQEQRALGLGPNEEGTREIRERLRQMTGLEENADPAAAIERTYDVLADTPSVIVAAALEDAFGVEERPNMPGTTTERPNWRMALPAPIDTLPDRPLAGTIAGSFKRRRRKRGQPAR